jgi:hypothetical protein
VVIKIEIKSENQSFEISLYPAESDDQENYRKVRLVLNVQLPKKVCYFVSKFKMTFISINFTFNSIRMKYRVLGLRMSEE